MRNKMDRIEDRTRKIDFLEQEAVKMKEDFSVIKTDIGLIKSKLS